MSVILCVYGVCECVCVCLYMHIGTVKCSKRGSAMCTHNLIVSQLGNDILSPKGAHKNPILFCFGDGKE